MPVAGIMLSAAGRGLLRRRLHTLLPTGRALAASWCALAMLVALHACAVFRALWRDAAAPNFAALPPEDQLQPLSRSLVDAFRCRVAFRCLRLRS